MTTPIVMAAWLGRHTHELAGLEAAGECLGQISDLVERIERTINRPVQPRYLGNCPHLEDQTVCAEPVYCEHDAVEAQCWKCKTTYNADELVQRNLSYSNGLNYTVGEIVALMEEMGSPVSERTLRAWRAAGKLVPRSEWGADEPRFWLNDVVKLRNRHDAAA